MSRDEGVDQGFQQFEKFFDEWSRRDFLRNMGAGAAYLAFMAGGLEFLEACAAGNSSTPGVAAKEGGHIVEASTSDLKTFNSVLTSDYTSQEMIAMVNDPLYSVDQSANFVPLIAKDKPQTSSDNLSYTINLRQGIKWTDGQEVTADDVVFTYQLMYDPAYKKVNSPRRGDLEKYVDSVTAKDKYTVIFKTKSVFAPFVSAHLAVHAILPKHVLGSLSPEEINTAPWNSAPTVTNGAFTFVKWDKDSQVSLAKNPKYYRGAPHLDSYVFKIGVKSTEVLNQMKTGEIDVAFPGIGTIDASQYDAAKSVDNINVYSYPRLSFDFFLFQLDPAKPASKFFSDKSVRQAMVYALDRKAIAHALYFDQATVANTSMPPASWAYNKDNKPVYAQDKAKAQSMLEAAGWKASGGGTRQKDGVAFKFEMITNAGNKIRENLLVVLQQQWKDVGIDATPKYVDFNKVLVPALTNTRNFELLMVGFSWNVDPDQSQVWHSRNTIAGGFNGMGYKNPELDKVLDDSVATLDQAQRKQLYFKMQQILAEDQPAPVLVFPNGILGLNKRVQNWQYGTFIGQNGRRVFMKDVFVSDGK
jgi:peptide/nickel transport system substrate-binding protein